MARSSASNRLLPLVRCAVAEADQVVRLGKLIVERDGVPKGVDGASRVAFAIPRQAELVEQSRRLLVEHQVFPVTLRGARITSQGVVDVAKQLTRPGGGGIELGRAAKILEGWLQLVATAFCLASPEVRDHRLVVVRNRSAEGFDCRRRVARSEGGIALGDERAVIGLPLRHPVAIGRSQTDDQYGCARHHAFHAAIV